MTATTTRRRRRELPALLYAHPFELGLGLAFLVIGIRGAIDGYTSPAVDKLPTIPLTLYQIISAFGGIGVVAGLVTRRKAFGRTLERASLYTVAGAWLAYGLLVFSVHGWRTGFSTGTIAILIGAACLLRALAIRKTERVILSTLRAANRASDRDPDLLRQLIDGRPPREPRE